MYAQVLYLGVVMGRHKTGVIHLCKGYLSCVVVMVIPSDGRLTVCRCMSPAYPQSPTRCWRYHFSYLDSGGDCGLGRCKRPAEARCLPLCQNPHLGLRMLNPLLDSHIQKYVYIFFYIYVYVDIFLFKSHLQ